MTGSPSKGTDYARNQAPNRWRHCKGKRNRLCAIKTGQLIARFQTLQIKAAQRSKLIYCMLVPRLNDMPRANSFQAKSCASQRCWRYLLAVIAADLCDDIELHNPKFEDLWSEDDLNPSSQDR
jgi:hypothetical protein